MGTWTYKNGPKLGRTLEEVVKNSRGNWGKPRSNNSNCRKLVPENQVNVGGKVYRPEKEQCAKCSKCMAGCRLPFNMHPEIDHPDNSDTLQYVECVENN